MTSGPPDPDEPVVAVELDDGTLEVHLPARLSSVRLARGFVHQRWTDLDDHTLSDVELIVAELVSNAVLHGRPDIVLRVRTEPFAVDLEVLDHGDELPSGPSEVDSDPATGRGLAIVDGLAKRWGVQRLDGEHGKVVWASIGR